jgi:hypothetical protein
VKTERSPTDENAIHDRELLELARLHLLITGERLPCQMSPEQLDASAARRKGKK